MKVSELVADLLKCPQDLYVVLSGDPEVLGDGAEAFPEELCPSVQNLTCDARHVVLWPDRSFGDTEPWNDPEDRPEPQPTLHPEFHRLEVPEELRPRLVSPTIYVASRTLPERVAMWLRLRAAGWPIVSTWIDEAGPGETSDLGELWDRIASEVRASSGVLLYAEAGDFPLKGAFVEVGLALGLGKPVAVVLPGVELTDSCKPVGTWIRHPLVTVCRDVDQARAVLLSEGS